MQQDYIGASWGVRFNQREMKRMRSHIADALLEGAEPDPDGGFGSVVVDALDRFTPDGGKDLPIDLPAIEDDQYDIFGDWIEEMTKFNSIDVTGCNTSPSKCAMITTARETTEKEIRI